MALYTLQNKVYNEKGELQYGGANAPGGTYVTSISSLDEISKLTAKYQSMGIDPSQENRALSDAESAYNNRPDIIASKQTPFNANNKLPTESVAEWQARTGQKV